MWMTSIRNKMLSQMHNSIVVNVHVLRSVILLEKISTTSFVFLSAEQRDSRNHLLYTVNTLFLHVNSNFTVFRIRNCFKPFLDVFTLFNPRAANKRICYLYLLSNYVQFCDEPVWDVPYIACFEGQRTNNLLRSCLRQEDIALTFKTLSRFWESVKKLLSNCIRNMVECMAVNSIAF